MNTGFEQRFDSAFETAVQENRKEEEEEEDKTAHEYNRTRSSEGAADKKENEEEEGEVLEIEDGSEDEAKEGQDRSRNHADSAHALYLAQRHKQLTGEAISGIGRGMSAAQASATTTNTSRAEKGAHQSEGKEATSTPARKAPRSSANEVGAN